MNHNPFSMFELILGSGLIGLLGWLSLVCLILVGCVVLCLRPQPKRSRVPSVFFAVMHVQFLLFALCLPVGIAGRAYATLEPIPDAYARDMAFANWALIINLAVTLLLSGLIAIRHKTIPRPTWLPVLCLATVLLDVFAVWSLKMVLCTWNLN